MISRILTELREAKGLSRKEVALHLGVHETTYGKYELGHREPDLSTARKLADFFNVSTDFLLSHRVPGENKEAHSKAEQADVEIEEGYFIVTAQHRNGNPITYKIPIEKAKPVLEIMKSLEDVGPPDYL